MSQEKVTRYKEEKKNRKAIMKKEKTKSFLWKFGISLVAVVIIGWIGYSAYDMYMGSRPRQMAEVDYSEVESYIQGLSAEETE